MRPTVAVVGAGVSGLTAAYILQRTHDVTLFEAEPRLGGHAHTHDVVTSDDRLLAVDTGFIVHNDRTYPHLLRLFAELGVATRDTEMSMSVRCDGCGLEYAGAKGFGGIFGGRRSHDPRFLRMLVEVRKFHVLARRALATGSDTTTLGEFIATARFSPYFVQHFMVPVVACVWSCPQGTALDYPARYLFQFFEHHGMLSVGNSPQWRTVVGGSREYVERAAKHLTAVHVGMAVQAVTRHEAAVDVRDAADNAHRFDRVVIATHADQALALLTDPTDDERSVLGSFSYSVNDTVLHTDSRVLPAAPRARASWNYLLDDCHGNAPAVRVSYDMNRLQGLDAPDNYLVTLNADDRIDPDRVVARMRYTHPVYTVGSLDAQRRLGTLATDRTAFAGAYHGWGFHEDGCASGLRAASAFGASW